MRMIILAAAVGFTAAITAPAPHAAPLAPRAATSGSAAIMPVAGGCGPGLYPRRWVDRFGRWHVRCAPGGRMHHFCPPGMVLRTWRGPYGHWHRRCVPI